MCWGDGTDNALGGNSTEATKINTLDGDTWTGVSAGDGYTCALDATASLFCWGLNRAHQASPSNDSVVIEPYQVPGTWKYVSAGEGYTLAIDASTEAALGWGLSESVDYDFATGGSLGDGKKTCYDAKTKSITCEAGTSVVQPTPVTVVGGKKWATVAAGGGVSCGVEVDTNYAYC